jgi:hypothetical protein
MPEENLSAMPEENLSATSTFSPMSVPKAPTPQQMDAPMSAPRMEDESMLNRQFSASRSESLVGGSESSANYRLIANLFN